MALIGLDIGHGNNTFPPSKGVYKNGKGYAEHDFNSKLGKRIKQLLEENGHTVILGQQPNARDVALRTRTNLYNRENVDLVVSIHANANASSGVNGRCVFYWHSSASGKKLAQSIINEFKTKGYSTHGNGLHASIVGSWTNLHITRETKAPAVLIEHGFMTGSQDFDLIFGNKQAEYIEDMAQADVAGIIKYLSGKPVAPSKPSKPTPAPKPKPSAPKKQVSTGTYTSGSIVDYLNRNKISSSFANRKKLAREYLGISNYSGTAKQNTDLLNAMRKGKPKPVAKPSSKWNYKGGNWTGDILRQGDYGPQVKQMQQMLAKKYFYPEKGAKNNGVDSYYGAKTKDAVRRFQSVNGLSQDGIAGPATYRKLR